MDYYKNGFIVLIIASLIFLVLKSFRKRSKLEDISFRDISCHQLCDERLPGLVTSCAIDDDKTGDSCSVFYSCIKSCEDRQRMEIRSQGEGAFTGNRYRSLES